MAGWRWLVAGVVATALTGSAFVAEVRAQEAGAEAAVTESPTDEEAAAQTVEEDLLDEDALDELVAPIALYPDALLAQIFVAATFPIDIIKADRFIDENAGLSDKERADQAATEDWDPSIATLAGGFPTVVGRMADEIDWTESLGDAVLAQTDDVLDAVQRMRSRAVAAGTLTSNEAQVVEDEGENIAIEPADPEVIYVPSYDAGTAYTAPPAGTVPVTTTTTTGTGLTTSGILTTGAIAFGSALLIDEIFDDDYDDDYWHGPNHIDWDEDEFYPRRGGVNVEGDVNIDRDRNRVRVDGGDRTQIGTGDRTRLEGRDQVRIGDNDRSEINRDAAWRPDPKKQADARAKLAERKGSGSNAAAVQGKLKAGGGNADARTKLQAAGEKRQAAGKPAVAAPGPPKRDGSAFKPGEGGKVKTAKAADRGKVSAAKAKRPEAARAKPAASKAAARPAQPKNIGKPKAAKAKASPRKPTAKKSSSFHKSSSGHKAKAASSRGKASRSGGGRKSGGGGGRRR